MSYCIVVGCKNRNVKKNYEQEIEEARNRKFSFHLFSQNIKRKNKWLEAINLKNYIPRKKQLFVLLISEKMIMNQNTCFLLEERSENQERIQNQETKRVKKSIEHHTVGSSDGATAEIEPWPPHTAGSASSDGATAEIEPWPSHTAGSASSDGATAEIEPWPPHTADSVSSDSATAEIESWHPHTAAGSASFDGATAEIEPWHPHTAGSASSDGASVEIKPWALCTAANTMIDPSTSVPNIMVDRSTSVSPERILNSPTKIRLREFHTREKMNIKRKLAVSDYTKKKTSTTTEFFEGSFKRITKKGSYNSRG
ncbi:PREDICTED: uncharacterized protein LOC105448371 [Wasmannia auropunctata]|uniref:uncharacterized protein LOC105448371 n=1 Tax=Wasmannia auropunctata TaxID=64793 RepID=UPI0005EEF599|nr:PREDICTED: uncharacterized protein LOC105448371 [Wasmannia auropunctata]